MMSMQIELSYARFFGNKLYTTNMNDLLRECVAKKLSLHLKMNTMGACISVTAPQSTGDSLSLTGRWRIQAQVGELRDVGQLILAPFLFLVEQMYIPYDSLYTLGRNDRSVADIFMRNLFYAACRRELIQFHTTPEPMKMVAVNCSRELMRIYLWIVKSTIKDQVLARDNALELILVCAHLPLFRFTNILIESGAEEFRHLMTHSIKICRPSEQKLTFKQIRADVLTSYKT